MPTATMQDILTKLKEVKVFVQKRDIQDQGILSASRYGKLQLEQAKGGVEFKWSVALSLAIMCSFY